MGIPQPHARRSADKVYDSGHRKFKDVDGFGLDNLGRLVADCLWLARAAGREMLLTTRRPGEMDCVCCEQ